MQQCSSLALLGLCTSKGSTTRALHPHGAAAAVVPAQTQPIQRQLALAGPEVALHLELFLISAFTMQQVFTRLGLWARMFHGDLLSMVQVVLCGRVLAVGTIFCDM